MKTTLNLDDVLYRRAKVKAAQENCTVSKLIEEGLTIALEGGGRTRTARHRVRLPLIPAEPGKDKLFARMTSEEIHRRLADLQSEADTESHEVSIGC